MAQSKQLTDQTTRHAVYLEGLKTGEVKKFAAFLKRIDKSLRVRLGAADLTEFSRTRMEKLLSATRQDIDAIYADYRDMLASDLGDLAEYEAGFEARNINKVLPDGFETVIPAMAQVQSAVFSAPLSVRGADGGKLLSTFTKDWTKSETTRVIGAIRQGYYEGQTSSKILQAVRGTRANKYRDGILAVSNRSAEAMVRTAVAHVASNARMATWEANDDILDGYEWLSTLDSRTSDQCRILDGQLFEFGNGPVPPIHIRCRSTTVAAIKGEYGITDKGMRSAEFGPVSADKNYYSWLKDQPAGFQNDVLGVKRAALLRNGGLTGDQFAKLSLGRNFKQISLAEMRERDPLIFENAGVDLE